MGISRRVIEGMLVVAILLDVSYWTIWFTNRDWIASDHTQAYYEFENAFPLADFWLGLACLLALVSLRLRRPSALLWLLCAGSAALYSSAWTSCTTSRTGSSTRGPRAPSRP